MTGIREELLALLTAIAAGGILRLSYHCVVCLRRIWKHSSFLVGVEDLIYWIGTAVYLFVQIYHTSDGVIRWYFALGVVFGAFVSTILIRKIKKMLKKIYDFHSEKYIAKNQKKRYHD